MEVGWLDDEYPFNSFSSDSPPISPLNSPSDSPPISPLSSHSPSSSHDTLCNESQLLSSGDGYDSPPTSNSPLSSHGTTCNEFSPEDTTKSPPAMDELNTLKRPRPESEGSSSDEDSSDKRKKRQHCKVPLPRILKQCLSNPTEFGNGAKWLEEGQTFAVKWKYFSNYYRSIGKSNARNENIKNRFGRFRIKKSLEIAPNGYDVIYFTGDWWDFEVIQNPISTVEEFHADPEAARALTQPTNIIDNQNSFPILEFLKRVQKITSTSVDMENLKELLILQSKDNVHISLPQFKLFNSRFGPVNQYIPKIRMFVNSNAVEWYHGFITKEESEFRLIQYFRMWNKSCYLLRATQPANKSIQADLVYIFALSFLYQSDGIPRHMRLYCNSQFQLTQCVPLFQHALSQGPHYQEKPVRNFFELFWGLGEPVIPMVGVRLKKENIPAFPDTYPDVDGYIPM